MEAARSIDEMSGSELLDHVDDLATTQRRCELEILRAAVQHAIINNPQTLDPEVTQLPGRERAVRYGGVGTESVAEFAAAELGARLGVSAWSAHSLIADALDLVIRLPRLWARVESLEVRASYARFVARRTRDLPIEQAGAVDERVAEAADGRIPWTRFEELVAAAVVAADPEAAAAREDEQATRVFARATRSTEDGLRGFYVRAPFAVIARLDATVQHLADLLAAAGDTDTSDQRRVKAILLLANPDSAVQLLRRAHRSGGQDADGSPDRAEVLPAVQVFVHLYRGTPDAPSEGVARVEGIGPITESYLRTHLSRDAKVTVTPVLDLIGQAPVDGYEIPDRHRQAVHLMCPADAFPFSPNTSRGKQIDHTEPYRHGAAKGDGQSRIGNYAPMTTFHHRIKTHAAWDCKQPYPGILLWRDPHGAYYLVDHTGTRRVRATA